MSFLGLHELAAARGDGLRPELRVLFERLAKGEPCEIGFRSDGMLQAGPDPVGAKVTPAKTQALGSAAMGGMPASPHQVALLTPRPGATAETTAAKATNIVRVKRPPGDAP